MAMRKGGVLVAPPFQRKINNRRLKKCFYGQIILINILDVNRVAIEPWPNPHNKTFRVHLCCTG